MLGLFEEQGRGKTTTARILRQAIDPHEVEKQPKPKSTDDLYVCSYGQWLTVYDNLSALSQEYSDAFCCISTEATYAKRELFTDFGMIQLKLARPQIITAIVDVVAAADLLDRSLVAKLPEIADVVDDDELLDATAALAPRVLGQLLDAAVLAVRDFAKTKLATRVRMVGPARWIEAGAPALGLEPGEFITAYLESVSHAHEIALEASVIGGALRRMLDHRDALARLAEKEGKGYAGPLGFEGTADELLEAAERVHSAAAAPASAGRRRRAGSSGQLRRIAPALRKLGYDVVFTRGTDAKHERIITIDTRISSAARSARAENNRPNRPNRPKSGEINHLRSDGSDGSDGRIRSARNNEHSSFERRVVLDRGVVGVNGTPPRPTNGAGKKMRGKPSTPKGSRPERAGAFALTDDWQDVPAGAVLPPGREVAMDSTGLQAGPVTKGARLMARSKIVWAGEWVRVRPFFNKHYPADGLCRICRRLSCAPGWFSIKSREFRCPKCFDAEKAHQVDLDRRWAEESAQRRRRRARD